jgi:hypothetical protein
MEPDVEEEQERDLVAVLRVGQPDQLRLEQQNGSPTQSTALQPIRLREAIWKRLSLGTIQDEMER